MSYHIWRDSSKISNSNYKTIITLVFIFASVNQQRNKKNRASNRRWTSTAYWEFGITSKEAWRYVASIREFKVCWKTAEWQKGKWKTDCATHLSLIIRRILISISLQQLAHLSTQCNMYLYYNSLKQTMDIHFPSALWHCWLGDRKDIRPVKNWMLVCWWWFDWSFAQLITPVVTTTSIIFCFSKHRLTQVHLENGC